MSENELVRKAASNDMEAIYTLIHNNYRDYLFTVSRRYYPSISDSDREELLSAFFDFIITPTGTGKFRLRSITGEKSPGGYIGRAFANFLSDRLTVEGRMPTDRTEDKTLENKDAATRFAPAGSNSADNDEFPEAAVADIKIRALLDAFESMEKFTSMDRYVLLTFLIGERFRGLGRPLKLRLALEKQLGQNASTIYNRYSDNKRKLSDIARKIMLESLN
ncbi:MAG: hypothetical protein K2L84_01335 [Muribaculaceae bacterium]|nr:hypothetical protein [Muribaculaceae bacterium]